jgi:hypothetical protein
MYHRVWRWRQAESDSGTRTFTCRAASMARRARGKEPDRVSSAIGIFPSELHTTDIHTPMAYKPFSFHAWYPRV